MYSNRTRTCFGMLVLTVATAAVANPPEDGITKQLSVQSAMTRARASLREMNSGKAVEALEENLPKVNGNPEYLVLLREAYRAHIRDLYLAGRPDLAKRYLERLCILEPGAAKDPALKAHVETRPRQFEQDTPKQSLLQFPSFKGWSLPNPFAKKEEEPKPQTAPTVPIARARSADVAEDPFDLKNQRVMPKDPAKSIGAKQLLSKGMSEFNLKRYADARVSFEMAYRADQSTLTAMREPWAYCIIDSVSRTMNQPGALPAKLPDLQKQVEGAIELAPGKMMGIGKSLLEELEKRAKTAPVGPPVVTASLLKVRHMGQNKEGWQVAQTPHFRIFHKRDKEFAERVADIAENTRLTMYRKWFGNEGVEWQPICELILHPDVGSYTHMTQAPGNSPGHSRIDTDPVSKRIVARRMDLRCDMPGMVDAVLPHEATHVVLAGMFGPFHVPRWADEGIAVLSEPNEKIEQHRSKLLKHHQDGDLFGLKELMQMDDYPQPRRVGAFYAQSVVLTEFLSQQRGPKVFAEFVKDGLRHGYDTALQRHYSMTFTQLEQRWQERVIQPAERMAAQR